MQKEYMDIEKLLQEGKTICIKPRGYSMYPVLVPGRDEVIVEPVADRSLRRGDVALYRRDKEAENGGILVLHRIWKVKPEGLYLVGDNQKNVEGPLRKNQMKGVMVGMNRKGKYISVTHPGYRLFTMLWLWMRPIRPYISKIMATIKRGFSRKQ